MKKLRYFSLAGLYMWKIYGVAKVLLVHFPLCETVSPYFKTKVSDWPCSVNRYLHIDDSGVRKCARCTVCPKGFQVQTKCGLYNDTVCEHCSSGWYNDVRGGSCKPCSGCKPGEFIRRICTSNRDTSCRKCPRNRFSMKENTTFCERCRRCMQNERVISKCDAIKDTKCGNCKRGYFRVSSTGTCLPCSHCPDVLQYRVVPECRDRLGIHHPDICWPSMTNFRYIHITSSSSGKYQPTDGVTDGNRSLQTKSIGDIPTAFFLTVAGIIVCSIVVILVGSICLRQICSNPNFNSSQSFELEELQAPTLTLSNRNASDNFESISDRSNSRTKNSSLFEESLLCCYIGDTNDEVSLVSGDTVTAKENTCKNRDSDARVVSTPVFYTDNFLSSATTSKYENSEKYYGDSSRTEYSKPWSSEHGIYQTI